jgi:hypothetical protein
MPPFCGICGCPEWGGGYLFERVFCFGAVEFEVDEGADEASVFSVEGFHVRI